MRTAAIAAALALTVLLALACGGDGSGPAATSTAPPAADATAAPDISSNFPVLLEHETLIVASADGSEITETPLDPSDRSIFGQPPRGVSPDRRRTAIYRDGMLMVQEGDGEPTLILEIPSESDRLNFAWSPDSRRLLFDASFRDESSSLFVINADGSGLTDVGAGLEGDAFPVGWSSDGETIAYALSDEATAELWLIDPESGDQRRLAGFESPNYGIDHVHWSPDGASVAVVVGRNDVYVIDVETGSFLFVATSAMVCTTNLLGWSPGSQKLYAVPSCLYQL